LFFASVHTIRAEAEELRSRTLNHPFLNPWVVRIQLRKLHIERDVLDRSAGSTAEVTVLLQDGIEAFLYRVRVQATDDSPGGHELQIAIHGSKADSGKPSPDSLEHLVGAGMIPAETEFLQDHGSLLRFSQNR